MHPTQKIITDTNKSPLIQVSGLMFLVIFLLVEDILIIAATVFYRYVSIECDNGLGKPASRLDPSEIVIFFKSQYAANTTFIASVFCSKLSCTVGLRMMSRENRRLIVLGFEAVVGGWGASALIINLFQGELPTPLIYTNDKRCIDRTAFWTHYSITNITTNIVKSVFVSRILVTPAIAVQIYHSNKAFASTDFTFANWKAAIALQLVQCLSIVTVCIPSFNPLFNGLESGQIRIDDLRRQGKSGISSYPIKRPRYSGYRQTEEATVTESQLSTVHELTDLSKSIARGAIKLTMEQKGGTWDELCRTSHSSETILIQQIC
ncbi:uncharacterized protein FOBCDRAFT_242198 [Fusarium oxysporum Fo47]|uniref:uncharacterized protein n=1 Tax=Fusarium oxysporum Fo47 TaxID=660027 RepID=UPI002869CA76|nr:uncharacterized protein FOBCDRAFT_242198 [Fusarium oxysporum Fo47]WJG35907.1 hypothetical protein FOBCDRAFT_242198 [Fusarium oxysporum Fo47]